MPRARKTSFVRPRPRPRLVHVAIYFKIALITFKILTTYQLSYLGDLLQHISRRWNWGRPSITCWTFLEWEVVLPSAASHTGHPTSGTLSPCEIIDNMNVMYVLFRSKLDTSIHRCLYGSTLGYLLKQMQRVSDVMTRQWLRSSSTTATSVWNSFLEAIRSSASLALFRNLLKMGLFIQPFISELNNSNWL